MAKYRKTGRTAYGLSDPLAEMYPLPIQAQRAPLQTDTGFTPGQLWLDMPNNDIWMLTENAGGEAFWDILNAMGPGSSPFSRYVVDGNGTAGFVTIQAAIDQAQADGGRQVIVIRPGTYTENLTLYSGISLLGTDRVSTYITGTHTPPDSGTVVLSNLFLTSATNVIQSMAAGTTNFFVLNCLFAITAGYVVYTPNFTGNFVVMLSCNDFGSTSNGVVNMGDGTFFAKDGTIGEGTANAATFAGTNVSLASINMGCPITVSGTGQINIFGGSLLNGTLTLSDMVKGFARNCTFVTGSDVAIVQNSFGSFSVTDCTIDSSALNVVTGVGIFGVGTIDFVTNSAMSVANVSYNDNLLSSKVRVGTLAYPVTSIGANDAVSQVFASDGTNMGNDNSGFRVNYEGANGCNLNECEGIRSNVSILAGGTAAELHGGFFGNTQNDGSVVTDLLCAVCAQTTLLESNVADQPSGVIAGIACALEGADGIDNPTAPYVCASFNLVTYHDCFDATAHGVIVSRDTGTGTGTTANAAFKVLAQDPTKTDWNFGLDLHDGLGALPYGTADIKLWNGSYIKSDASAMTLQAQLGTDVNVQLGDIAGANKLNVYSSAPALVASIDSTGTGVFGTVQCTLAPIGVPSGGTGLSAVTQYAMLYGDNVSSLVEIGPLADGELIIGQTGAAPVAASLTAGTGITITPGAGSITIDNAMPYVDENDVFYVGKHGNDGNSGKTIDQAFLTFGAAVTAAAVSFGAVVCLDAGIYIENIVLPLGVYIYAPNIMLAGSIDMGPGQTRAHIGYITDNGIAITCVQKTGAGDSTIIIDNMNISNAGSSGFSVAGAGVLEADVNSILFAAGKTTTSVAGTLDLHANMIGCEIQQAGAGNIYVNATEIRATINVDAGQLAVKATNLSAVTVCDISGGVLDLDVTYMAGATVQTGGTFRTVSPSFGIDNVTVGAITPTTGTFTTLAATLTDHTILVGSGISTQVGEIGPLTDGQLLIGSTGNDPVAATLTAGSGIGITEAAGSITISNTAFAADQVNIYYVGKHGDDLNDGKSIGEAKLTFGGALLVATASDAIVCFDNGLYNETLTDTLGVRIYAPNAGLKGGGHTMAASSDWTFYYTSTSGISTAITLNSAGAIAYFRTNSSGITSTGPFFDILDGSIIADIRNFNVSGGGVTSITSLGSLDLVVQELNIASAAPVFNMGSGFRLYVSGGRIVDPANTATLLYVAAPWSAYANMNVGYLEIGTLSNITATSTAYISASELSGPLAEVGAGTVTGLCSATDIDGATIGSRIPAPGTFTTLAATLTDHAVLVGAGTTAAITQLAVGTNGQVLVGSNGADPIFATLGSTDSTIGYTVGAGTLTLQARAGTEAQTGVVELASNAETTTGTSNTLAVHPEGLNTRLGTQTVHGVMLGGGGAGTNLAVTAAGTNGQVLVGSTGVDPVFATLGSTGGTISYTPGAGTLNLEVTAATELQVGGLEIATDVEAVAITATDKIIVPSNLGPVLASPPAIGGTSANTGTFTTAYATTFDTNIAAAAVTLTGTTLAADGTDADINISVTPKGTGSVVMTKVDVGSGEIDGTVIGSTTPALVTGTELRASSDLGGATSQTSLTNATSGVSTGVGSVKLAGTTARDNDLWLKFYVGTTAYYAPVWSNIS